MGFLTKKVVPKWLTYLLALMTLGFLISTIVLGVQSKDEEKTKTIYKVPVYTPETLKGESDGKRSGLFDVYEPAKIRLSPMAQAWYDKMTVEEKAALLGMSTGGKIDESSGIADAKPILALGSNYPIPLGLGATWDSDLVQRVVTNLAATQDPGTVFGPTFDTVRDSRMGMMGSSFGEDVTLVRALGIAAYSGIRANDQIQACLPAIFGSGSGMTGGLEFSGLDQSWQVIMNDVLAAYPQEIIETLECAEAGQHTINGVAGHGNKEAINDILRGYFGFDGVVTTAKNGFTSLVNNRVADDIAAARAIGVGAGIDLCVGTPQEQCGEGVFKAGSGLDEAMETSTKRLLRLKDKLGLLKHSVSARVEKAVDTTLAEEAATKSAVLLQNSLRDGEEAPILPIVIAKYKTVLVIGQMAHSKEDQGADQAYGKTYLQGVAETFGVNTIEEPGATGCIEAGSAGGTSIHYCRGWKSTIGVSQNEADELEATKTYIDGLTLDLVVSVVGEDASAWGKSRSELRLPKYQQNVLDLIPSSVHHVLVVTGGRPQLTCQQHDETTYRPEIPCRQHDAEIVMWQSGLGAGGALKRLLLGDSEFTGRLPVTVPRSMGQIPIRHDRLHSGRPWYKKDEDTQLANGVHLKRDYRFTSRYMDSRLTPLHPFGFGMTYSKYVMAVTKKPLATYDATGTIEIDVEVTRTGGRTDISTTYNVQAYAMQHWNEYSAPVMRRLKGFGLAKFEGNALSATTTIQIPVVDLAVYDSTARPRLHSGPYTIFVSSDAEEEDESRTFEFTVKT